MKNMKLVEKTPYVHPQLELDMATFEGSGIEFARRQAQELALREGTLDVHSYTAIVEGPIHCRVQAVVDGIRTRMLIASGVAKIKDLELEAQILDKKAQVVIYDTKNKQSDLEARKKRIQLDPQKVAFFIWGSIMAIAIGTVDGTLAFTVFQSFYPFVLSLVLGGAVAIMIGVVPSLATDWVRKAPTKVKRSLRIALTSFAAFVVFYWMAIQRTQAAQGVINIDILNPQVQEAPTFSPEAIAALSFMFFFVLFIATLRYKFTTEELRQYKEYRAITKQVQALGSTISELEKSIADRNSYILAERAALRERFEYATKSIKRAKHIGEASIATFKQDYGILHPPVPAFFQNSINLQYDDDLGFF